MTAELIEESELTEISVAGNGDATEEAGEPRPSDRRNVVTRGLYSVVWRWHFYAGLISAPILLMVILTGSLYVFRTELTAWQDRGLREVAPQAERKSYDELREIARKAAEPNELEGIFASADPGRSVLFVAHVEPTKGASPAERHEHVYVDPYTGAVLGKRIAEEDFFAIVLELHRSLMLGSTGRILSELATSWGVILLATGVYLWWPRGKKNVRVWLPRLTGKLYGVLRDWHAVSGVYLAPLAGLVMVTGLVFTLVWGTGFNTTAKQIGHWPAHWFAPPKSVRPTPETPPASLDRIVPVILEKSRPGDLATIRFPVKPDVGYKAFLMRDEDKNSLRMVEVDQYSAALIKVVDVAELPLMYRMRVWSVSIHMGQIFGTPTKILALLTTLGLLGLTVTGVWMWWERRPRGRSGFPRRPMRGILPAWGWGLVVATALLLPVAGGSMVLIGGADRVVQWWKNRRA